MIILNIYVNQMVIFQGVEDDLIDSNFRLHPTYTEVVMLGVGVICQQGSFCEPNKSSGRLVMFFFLIFLMFLYISYSAHIVVLLQSTSTSIRTIQDLVDSNLGVVAEDTIYFRYYLVVSIIQCDWKSRYAKMKSMKFLDES